MRIQYVYHVVKNAYISDMRIPFAI